MTIDSHWNCLFVSNQGAFNVSHVSGRSALISDYACAEFYGF